MSEYIIFITALKKLQITINISVASNNIDLESSDKIAIDKLSEYTVKQIIFNLPFRLEFMTSSVFNFELPIVPDFLKKAYSVSFVFKDYPSIDNTYHQFIDVAELKIDLDFVDIIKFHEFKQLKQLYLRHFLLQESRMSIINNSLEHLILSREEYNSELSLPLKILDITGTPNSRKLHMYSVFNKTEDKKLISDVILC